MFQLYKPNKGNTGTALGFKFNSKDQNLFLNIIKQNGFNGNGKGAFSGGKYVMVALGAHEIGGILSVINDLKTPIYKTDKAELRPVRREQSYHHESAKQSSKLKFAPYLNKDTGEVRGLSIGVNQTLKETGESTPFSFWAAPDELVLLEEYLKFVLNHFFMADYSADKKAFEDSQKGEKTSYKKDKKQDKQEEPKEEKAAQPSDSDEDNW